MAKRLIAFLPQEKGYFTVEDEPLGRGGEGTVYPVASHELSTLPPASELVVKLYHAPNEGDRANKVKAMVKYAPESTSVAWPLAVVLDASGLFLGYVMKKLPSKNYRPWAELAHAKSRRGTASSFDVRYGVTAVRNLAVALSSVHRAGHRVGDINESNIFVGADARVLLVDTDSAQIATPEGKVFPCPVGKPEYTSPELSHGSLKGQTRTVESDVFGFAVAVYQMLTGGAHPTDGAFTAEGDPPSVVERIRQGCYPGLNSNSSGGFSHPQRIATSAIPQALQSLILASLAPNAAARPSLEAWSHALDSLLPRLQQCSRVASHWYDGQDGGCGWCAHAQLGRPDPWGLTAQQAPKQFALPAVTFEDSSGNTVARRAAPAAAGQSSAQAHQAAGGAHSPVAQAPPGYAFPPGQGPAPAQPQPQHTPPPSTYKGHRTLIQYADGSEGPRPDLSVLLRGNPKLAFQCIKNETPDWAKFWWPPGRELATPLGLGVGLALAVAFALSWFFALPLMLQTYASPNLVGLWSLASILAAFGTLLASVWLTFSGFWDRRRARRSAGTLANFKPEAPLRTAVRFGGLAVVYGPLLVLAVTATVILLAFNVLIGLLRNASSSNSY